MARTKKKAGPVGKRRRWPEEDLDELYEAMQVYGRNFAAIVKDERFGKSLGIYSDLDLANKYSYMCQIRDPRFAFFRETAKDSPRIVHSTVSSRYSTSASNVASPLRNSNSTAGHTPKPAKASPPSKRSSPTKKVAESVEVIRVFDVEAEEDPMEKRPAYAQFSVQLDNGKRAWLPREELPVSARLPLKRMINVLRLKLRVSEEEYARLGRIEESGSEVEDDDEEDELEMEDGSDDDDGKGKKKAATPTYTIKNVTLYGESRKEAGSSSPSVRSPRKTQISWEDYLKKELPQVRSEADEDGEDESGDASEEDDEEEDGVELRMESVHEESDEGSHAGTEDTSESEGSDGSSSSDLMEAAEVIYQTQMMHSSPKSSPAKGSPAKSSLPLSIQASPAKALPVRPSSDVPSKRSSTGVESAEDRAKRVAERMATARKTVDKKPSAGCPVM